MPAYFSDNGKLSFPNVPHSTGGPYAPVVVGKPVVVEILHMAFGAVKDWWGKSEILVSSWAKTGGNPKPAVRVVNVMRKGIAQFDHLSSIGAADYGHTLVFYTPVYGGEILRFSLEYLEIDKIGKNGVEKLGGALQSLGGLPVFAPQLAYLALAPQALEWGRKLYNIINRNDPVLVQHLDLSFDDPDSNRLESGRYVLVNGNADPVSFMQKFELGPDNQLRDKSGMLAEEAGLSDAYIVIRINAVEKPEYKDFESASAAQEIIDEVLTNETMTESIVSLISDTVKSARQFGSVRKVLELKKGLDKTADAQKKGELKKKIEDELKKLSDDQASLLNDALGL